MNLDSSYPTAVFCIIATEFCERFSFCGLRTILSLYLRNVLRFNEDSATIIYHVFIMICYVIPVVGAICADSFLGRYRTIRNFSVIYLLGNLLMCVAAIPVLNHNPIVLSFIALLLIAIGTGGLKPCVAAFGAEQFQLPEQADLLRYYFSVFYFTINLGGFLGMTLTPVMRKASTCFGEDTCYTLGFGFPALLMVISILLFMLGKPVYKLKMPRRNIILQFIRCSCHAIKAKCKGEDKFEHWLDYARDAYDWKLIQDMKMVCAILFLFIPLPIFWSLFDQQGSRWTFQASHMDGNLVGVQIAPDQMQVINPVMVLFMIPLFDKILYPCCDKVNALRNSLHRMVVGGMCAGLAFVGAGILELVLETTYPPLPEKHHGSVNIINTLTCSITISSTFNKLQVLDAAKIIRYQNMNCLNQTRYSLTIEAPKQCGNTTFNKERFEVSALLQEAQEDTIIIVNQQHEVHGLMTDPVDFTKSVTGAPKFRIDFVKNTQLLSNITMSFLGPAGLQEVYFLPRTKSMIVVSPYIEIARGVYECRISSQEKPHLLEKHFHFAIGGVYSLVIVEDGGDIVFVKLFTISDPNSVNMLWQTPQYALISIAEIMFGVAGLEFSFTQAPKSMKTVTIAGWYLSTAFGNFLVIVVTQLNMFDSQAHEFFLFALLIVADMVLFMEMASRYHFVQLEVDSSAYIMEQPLLQDYQD